MNPIRVFSLFSGIGAFEKALLNASIPYTLIGFSEIDRYAVDSYVQLYDVNPALNFGDASEVSTWKMPDFDLLVGGSPCQSFSVSGNRTGFQDTRGTLFFSYAEMLKRKQPKYFIYENVKHLINNDNGNTFNIICQTFCQYGYTIDFHVMNSRNYGIPQDRERLFVIGVLDWPEQDWNITGTNVLAKGKKRIKQLPGIKTFNFNWLEASQPLPPIDSFIESNVQEKYYLSPSKTQELQTQIPHDNRDIRLHEYSRLTGIGKELQVAYTINASDWRGLNRNQSQNAVVKKSSDMYKVRRLIPKESWRFMGFTDEDFNKVEPLHSDTQLYQQAGNSIVVPVLEHILANLFFPF